jgi:hypothetical protein
MAELQERARQLQLRLVYFGPPGSGKAANLQWIHDLLPAEVRSRIRAFASGSERTVSFDMTFLPPTTAPAERPTGSSRAVMPATPPAAAPTGSRDRPTGSSRAVEGPWKVRVTISGCSSPLLKDTKLATLEASDAIAFVADGARGRREENHEAYREMEELLRARRGVPPIVLQVNKRDLPDVLSEDEIEREWGGRGWPIFTAAADRGEGVRETFTCLLRLAWEAADRATSVAEKTGLSLEGLTSAAVAALRRGVA